MAGPLKTSAVQLGDSATPSQNFVLRTNVDGTATLARGNLGATTQDILTINADGGIKLNQAPAFRATGASQNLATNTDVKMQFPNESYDTSNAFDAVTNHRFQPLTAGYYQVSCNIQYLGAAYAGNFVIRVYKNGVNYEELYVTTNTGMYTHGGGSVNIYLNGSTDYVEIFAQHSQGTTQPMQGVSFSGFLVRAI